MSDFNTLTVQIVGDTPANASALRDAIADAAQAMGFEVVTSGALRFSGAPTMTLRRLPPDWKQDAAETSRLPFATGGVVTPAAVVISRPECVFAFCPHGHDCSYRHACRHKRADTADETK
jgi:hypothetical protein